MSWHGVCNQTYAQFAAFIHKCNINTSHYLCHWVLSAPRNKFGDVFSGSSGQVPLRQSGAIHLPFPFPFVKTVGNGRAEKGVPLVDFPNRVAHIVNGGLFDQIAHRAGVGRLFDIRFITVRRKHEHFGGGDGFENLARGLQTIEQRHGNVHQNQCGTEFFDHGDRLMAVFRFADHFKIVFEFQYLSNFPANERVVVRQQDSDFFHINCFVTNIETLALI